MAKWQLVVLIKHDQWLVMHFKGSRYHATSDFSVNVENQLLLLNLLKKHAQATLYFLTDIADEHYHVEVLPKVSGTARKQLLARRLAAWPFSQELHAVHKVDSVQTARKEDRYLFSAIHYPPLRDWLQALQQPAIRIRGVYTQALCFPCAISNSQSSDTHCLYAYLQRHQLRIHYHYKTKLLFSRLLTLKLDESLHSRISNEVAQTRLYLISQQWLQEKEPLHLVWLSEDKNASGLSPEQLPAAIKQTCKTFADVIGQSGLEHVPNGLNEVDWAAVQVVLRNRQLPNFAPEVNLLSDRVHRGKRNITLAGGAMIILCLVVGWLGQQSIKKTQFSIQKTKASISEWQAAKPAWGFADADLPRLQTLSLGIQRIENSTRRPDRALGMLQGVMTHQKFWQVKKVEWHYGPALDQAKQTDNQWNEKLSVTFSKKENATALNARQEWQLLLEDFRQHPDILELKETHSSPASSRPEQQGDTRQLSQPDDQPTIDIRLRPQGRAAT
ncbi:MAG TPA: hypothetical protein VK950_03445 [Methylophilus sp.]|nr:hypothetical protein [Methylophilus sp.]